MEMSRTCLVSNRKGLSVLLLLLLRSPFPYLIFKMSESDQSELSDTLNTTAFDTITYATAGDLPNAVTATDFVEINRKSYFIINYTAN
jgi:hypothetical protein